MPLLRLKPTDMACFHNCKWNLILCFVCECKLLLWTYFLLKLINLQHSTDIKSWNKFHLPCEYVLKYWIRMREPSKFTGLIYECVQLFVTKETMRHFLVRNTLFRKWQQYLTLYNMINQNCTMREESNDVMTHIYSRLVVRHHIFHIFVNYWIKLKPINLFHCR